jgi:predicted O-methyltransferase YrrM
MPNITDYILSKTQRLKKEPEISPGDHGFEMFNDAGTEVEVSEFLYSFVRLIKPEKILETGTHLGVSTAYMAQACADNDKGGVVTFEIIPQHWSNAQQTLREVGVSQLVNFRLQASLEYTPPVGTVYDLLFLDSEPHLRFNEFVKYWDYLRPGGYIIIHDLNNSLGHHGQTYHETYDWPYGDFREKIGPYMKSHDVQTVCFDNPRGMSLFQKSLAGSNVTKYMKGEI